MESPARNTAVLPALDRTAPWNDLPLLDEIVGDARVVAVGEAVIS